MSEEILNCTVCLSTPSVRREHFTVHCDCDHPMLTAKHAVIGIAMVTAVVPIAKHAGKRQWLPVLVERERR